jgi:hypothetical protein
MDKATREKMDEMFYRLVDVVKGILKFLIWILKILAKEALDVLKKN